MGCLETLLLGGGAVFVARGLRRTRRAARETRRRKASVLHFSDGITWPMFNEIVHRTAAQTPEWSELKSKG